MIKLVQRSFFWNNIYKNEDAYDILNSSKEETESFSEVIVRLSGKKKLASFAGGISEGTGQALEKELKSMRKAHRFSHKQSVSLLMVADIMDLRIYHLSNLLNELVAYPYKLVKLFIK